MEKTNKNFAKELASWEKRFPGKGAALMEILGPFYYWKPELKPAELRLEARARVAIHWKEFNGLVVCNTVNQYYFLKELGETHYSSHTLGASLGKVYWESLNAEQALGYKQGLCGEISLLVPTNFGIGNVLNQFTFNTAAWVGVHLDKSLNASLTYASGLEIAGRSVESLRFNPLLDLWLAGNFPVGFDNEGNLLVLVAD